MRPAISARTVLAPADPQAPSSSRSFSQARTGQSQPQEDGRGPRRSARPCEPVSHGSLRVWPGLRRAGPQGKARRGAGPAVPLLIQYSPIRQCRRPRRCPDRLPCQTMASSSAAVAASAHYVRLRPWTFPCRRRGTVRGTTRRIIPAQLVPSVRLPVPSVQLARVQPVSTLLVNGRSDVF